MKKLALILAMSVAVTGASGAEPVAKKAAAPAKGCVAGPTVALAGGSMTHKETGLIADSGDVKAAKLSSFCLDAGDNILACDEVGKCIRVITPGNKLKAKWDLAFGPQAIARGPNGTTVVGGGGTVVLLDSSGAVKATATVPGTRAAVSGIGAGTRNVFVAARAGTSFAVYRFDWDLKQMKQIIRHLRGCCGQMDIAARGNDVYVAVNTKFKVIRYDSEGKQIAAFGQSARQDPKGFGGCCNPMNIDFGPGGEIYTSEAATVLVKRWSPDGKLIETVGQSGTPGGCVRVTIAVSKDGSKVYILDTKLRSIHVLSGATVAKAGK